METRTLTTKRGMSIETNLTDDDAVDTLKNVPGTFAADLYRKGCLYMLSADQMAWAHKLAVEHLAKQSAPAPTGPARFARIMSLFAHASQHVLYPKIRFRLADGSILKLSLCGTKSKHAGSVTLTDGGSYPNNRFYGRITPAGHVESRNLPMDVAVVLDAFESDPAGIAKNQAEGDVTCIFCQKELDTIESRANGYGPVCAKNYGLPWDGANNATVKPKAKRSRKPKTAKIAIAS